MERTFHRFMQLSTELRIKIWCLIAPEPCMLRQGRHWDKNAWRYVGMVYTRSWTQSSVYPYPDKRGLCFRRSCPVVLHVCRESRNEFLGQGLGRHSRSHHPVYQLCTFDILDPPIFFSALHDAVLATLSGIWSLSQTLQVTNALT